MSISGVGTGLLFPYGLAIPTFFAMISVVLIWRENVAGIILGILVAVYWLLCSSLPVMILSTILIFLFHVEVKRSSRLVKKKEKDSLSW